ncbi:hypothetical protein ACQ4LE_007981 [Meloidogyne hapla]|uniref:Dimer_Tnp_hAT domain-containing protein n=1 Tax=Meloidogyne hapla TaxID=6305 RepID=A0A1I8BSZ9_MELHA
MRNRNSKYDAYFHIFDGTAKCLGKDCNYFYKSISSSFPRTCLRAHLERYHKDLFEKLKAEEDQQQEKPVIRPVRKRVKKENKLSTSFDYTSENVNNTNWCSPNDELLLMTEKVEDDDGYNSKLDEAIMCLICTASLPISFVEEPGLKNLLNILVPDYKLRPHRFFSSSVLNKLYSKVRQRVNDDLNRTDFISLTVNSQKSNDDAYTLFTFTAHYISSNMSPCSRVLAVEPVKGEQTCENVNALLSNVLNEYRVDAFKVHLILREENDDDLKMAIRSTGFDSIQCLTIKLDLCIWEALTMFSANELLEKVKKAIRKIRKSRVLSDNFPSLYDDNSISSAYLKKGTKIRWNNALIILERFSSNEEFLIKIPYNNKLFPVFSPNEWKTMKNICELLRPIYRATNRIASRQACISSIIPLFKAIDRELLRLNTDSPLIRDKLREELALKFGECEDCKPLLIATLLDPAYKDAFFRDPEKARDILFNEVEMLAIRTVEPAPTTHNGNNMEDDDPFVLFCRDSKAAEFATNSKPLPSTTSPLESAKAMAAWQVNDYLNSPKYDGDSYSFWDNPYYASKYMFLLPLVKKFHSAPNTTIFFGENIGLQQQRNSCTKLLLPDVRRSVNNETLKEMLFIHQNLLVIGFDF